MYIKKLLILTVATIALAGCKKDAPLTGNSNNTTTTPTTPATPSTPKTYSITETFDSGTKGAYADGTVTLNTGVWDLNDAVIGNLPADLKDGTQSVRLRTGDIAMDFDVSGLNMLYIKHGKYGSDPNSTWQLLMSTDGGATYTQVGSDISETNTTLVTDSFKVTATSKVRFEIKKSTGTSGVNIDDITFKGTGDPGITVGANDTSTTDTTGTSKAAPGRTVNTTGPDVPPSSGDNSNLLFGNPSLAQTSLTMGDNYLIDQGYYVESYNATHGTPNWVSWHLDATNIGSSGRSDSFAAFSGLPTSFYMVQSNSYSGSGFDRGHNCPSADRTSSTNANQSTFLMTNMIPQAPNNNEDTWANLENYLREQVLEGNEVYIIMGNYGTGGTGSNGTANTINGGHINVPAHVWKVAVIIPVGDGDLLRVNSSTRVIAVDTPNQNNINADWTKYIVTVRDIEKETGYNLLSALPQSVQDAIEVKTDTGT